MSNTVKKATLIFTLLCVLVVIVFSVELVLLNRGRENTGLAALEPPHASNPHEDEPTQPNQPPPEEPPENGGEEPPEQTEPTEVLTRVELELVSDSAIIIYIDEEMFENTALDLTWLFSHTEEESEASLEISLIYMSHGAEAYARSVLDGYLEGGTSNFVGERDIASSNSRGFYAVGRKDTETYAAWIIALNSVEGNNLGVAIIINYSNNDHRDMLYSVLDTLEIITQYEQEDTTDEGD